MQPHLKKCFEGIAKLEFTPDLEIVGIISSEKETVPFSEKLYPAQAKVLSVPVCNVCSHMPTCLQYSYISNIRLFEWLNGYINYNFDLAK